MAVRDVQQIAGTTEFTRPASAATKQPGARKLAETALAAVK
jgi:hypothetical protein